MATSPKPQMRLVKLTSKKTHAAITALQGVPDGTTWRVESAQDEVSWSDRAGPWLRCVSTVNCDVSCWVHETRDLKFTVTSV